MFQVLCHFTASPLPPFPELIRGHKHRVQNVHRLAPPLAHPSAERIPGDLSEAGSESNWNPTSTQLPRLPPNQLSTQSPFCNWAGFRIWQSSCQMNWKWHENKGRWPWFSKETAFKINILTFFYLMSIYTQLLILQSLQSCNVGFHLYHKLWGHLHLSKKMVRQSCPAAPKSFASALWATRCLKQSTNFHVISKKYKRNWWTCLTNNNEHQIIGKFMR